MQTSKQETIFADKKSMDSGWHVIGFEIAPFAVFGNCQLCGENPGAINIKVHYESGVETTTSRIVRVCSTCLKENDIRFITSPNGILRDLGEYRQRQK